MVDSTIHVSNVTGLVIAMEVTVDKAAHCCQYHSHSNLSRLCVEMLTADRSHDMHNTRVNQLPRLHMTPARGSKSPNPSRLREINNLPRTPDTNYRARVPPRGDLRPSL